MKHPKKCLSSLKTIAIVVSLLMVFSTLVAGVVDTKARISHVENQQAAAEARFDKYCEIQGALLGRIRDILHEITLGQALLKQRLDLLLRKGGVDA